MYQSIVNSLHAGIWVVDRSLELKFINNRAFEHLNQMQSIEGKPCYKEIFALTSPCGNCPVLKTFKRGATSYNEVRLRHEGQWREYRLTATPLYTDGKDNVSLVVEMIQDITWDKRAEEELRRVNAFNRAIIDNAPLSIFTLDEEGQFTSVNQGLAGLSGLGPKTAEKLIGFNWMKNPYTIKCGLAGYIERGLQGETFQLWDFPFITYMGDRTIYMDFRGVPLRGNKGKVEGLLCIIEETTERVKVRAQMMQEAKMAAIGRLAAGVAHELNNPLATLSAYSELAHDIIENRDNVDKEPSLQELRDYLDVIEEQAFRCKRIIGDLLDLTRRDVVHTVEVDVNELLENVLSLLDLRKMNVQLDTSFCEDLPSVKADPNALKQVFLNLLNNALDAIEGEVDAVITVRSVIDGSNIRIEVEDNGMGIPDSIIDKIFEPFFTTKESGKGMGLGLALCYELVSKMSGTIAAEARPGRGSLFTVLLPVRHE